MYKKIATLSLFIICASAGAQTAEDYFHHGAQYYIFGEKQKAKSEIETGLKKYPNDPQLNQLAGLLKTEEEQKQKNQQKQQQDQSNKDPDNQSQQNQSSSGQKQDSQKDKQQEQSQNDKSKQDQQQQAQKDKKPSEKKDKDQSQASGQPKDKSKEEAEREAAAMAAGEMTPQQAQQLLDSQKDDDQVLRLAPPNKNNLQSRPYKNW